jgi:hypothetical protein
VYSVSSRKLSDAKICTHPMGSVTYDAITQKAQENNGDRWMLTMGLSGSLGSVMTKFFSIRSSVVARSIPCLMSLSLSSLARRSGSGAGAGASLVVPVELFFPFFNLPKRNHVSMSHGNRGAWRL